ncbi:hypothetical protein JCM10213v2_009011 [Rhodosporidiobolus nylandii]
MAPSLRSSSAKKQETSSSTQSSTSTGGSKAKKGGGKASEGGGGGKAKKPRKSKQKAKDVVPLGRDLFSSLPLDVLLDISANLDPGTLLAISQTSKAVRSTLCSKSAEPLWLAARKAASMPELETQDMSEPLFAHLIQGNACQVCGITKKTEVDHYVRVRACHKCLQQNLRIESYIREKNPGLHYKTFECSLSTKSYYFIPDVLKISAHLLALDPSGAADLDTEHENTAPPPVDPAVAAYVLERKQFIMTVGWDADTIFSWEAAVVDADLKEDEKLREKRADQINKKLMSLGHDIRDVKPLYDIEPAYRTSRPLNEADWRYFRRQLEHAATRQKVQRLREKLRPFYSSILWAPGVSYKARRVYLPFTDWLHLPSIKLLWQEDKTDVDAAVWPTIRQHVMEEMTALMRATKLELFQLVASALRVDGSSLPANVVNVLDGGAPNASLSDADMDPILARVTALFSCALCHKKFPFDECYSHVSEVHSSLTSLERVSPELDCLLPHANFRNAVLQLLRSTDGLDEAVTTSAQLEGGNMRFVVRTSSPSVSRWYYPLHDRWAWITRNVDFNFWGDWYHSRRKQRPALKEEDVISFKLI